MRDSFFFEVFLPTVGIIALAAIVLFLIAVGCEFGSKSLESFDNSEKTLVISEDLLKRVSNLENVLGIDQRQSE